MIKVGFCVAYDWELLKNSIPPIYERADRICLGIDKDRHSWACNPYEIDNDAFYEFVKGIDTDNKIDIYEDDFSLENLNSRENCNRHRMLIAESMGKGGWHIQIDSDEYFLDFNGFTEYLKAIIKNPSGNEKPLNVNVNLIPLYKQVENGYLYVDFEEKPFENAPFATNAPLYERARNNGYFNHISPFIAIHETWARNEDQLWYKLKNWGHAAEELESNASKMSYFNLWKTIDKFNYKHIRNINPARPEVWPALDYCEASSIADFIEKLTHKLPDLNTFALKMNNNRNIARLKSLFNSKK